MYFEVVALLLDCLADVAVQLVLTLLLELVVLAS